MNNNPKISVVMTVFNGGKFVKRAIDSILSQTLGDFEFVIVDNASTDKTKDIIASFSDPRIILIENKENLGQTKALNIGVKRSRGEFIARMDADDISMPQRFETQYKYLLKNTDVAVVGSWFEEVNEAGRHIKYYKTPVHFLEIKSYLVSPGELGYYCISHPTVLMRKSALLDAGFYNESYYPQDYDLWVRIVRKHKIVNLNEFLVKHMVSTRQQSKEYRSDIVLDLDNIIMSNIKHYLPSIDEKDAAALVRMLQYMPQKSREDGLKVLNIFNLFFKEYMGAENVNKMVRKIKDKMRLFYLLQLFKTNFLYSAAESLKTVCRNPDLLCEKKLYGKIMKTISNN